MLIDATQLNALTVTLSSATPRMTAQAATLTVQTALDIEGSGKAFVPKVTGTLSRSIHTEISNKGLTADIGTDLEYARRVEKGFVGADSLGRVYDQAPQPYMGPAFERHAPSYITGMQNIAGGSVLGTR